MRQLIDNFRNTMVFLKGYKLPYSIGIVGKTIVESTAVLLESYLLKTFLDAGTPKDLIRIAELLLLIVVYVIVIMILSPIFTHLFNANAKYGHGNVNKAIYHKYTKLRESELEQTMSGEFMSLFLNDTWVVSSIFMRHFRRVVASLVTILIYLVPMLVFDWRITLIMVVLNIMTLIVNVTVSKRMKAATKEIQEKLEDLTSIITNIVSGMSVLRIYQRTKQMCGKFHDCNGKIAGLQQKRIMITAWLAAYNYGIYILNIVVFLILGSFMVEKGLTTFGNILAIMSLQTAMDANFREFGEYYPQFFHGLAATERVHEFLNGEEEPVCWKTGCETFTSNEDDYITFEHVDFSYDGEHPVLADYNMAIKKGEHVALVGESGCGKSSIAKLLLGFYPVNGGRIAIDGNDIDQTPLEKVRDYIAYVPQEPAIFAVSIMENIRYGRSTATDEEVMEAARRADAYDFIMNQENGFATMAGEGGVKLSGGQRQRIAIARAILKDAPILLLDEATSALDNVTEARIVDTLNRYGQDRTTITIAHRSASIESADRVIYME